jgi:hypothetical protein
MCVDAGDFKMKDGDLVRFRRDPDLAVNADEAGWVGIVIGWKGGDPIVMWNEDFKDEREYRDQLEVINETR